MVNGKLEAKLADGTYYALQEKMEEIDQNYNGIKWASFNAGREEPRFAGLDYEETEEEEEKNTGDIDGLLDQMANTSANALEFENKTAEAINNEFGLKKQKR